MTGLVSEEVSNLRFLRPISQSGQGHDGTWKQGSLTDKASGDPNMERVG